MKLNWAERWVVNNPSRVIQQRIEISLLKKKRPLGPGATVLEVGCGRGAGAGLILETFHPAVLHASDLDLEMVQRAKRYLSLEQLRAIFLHVADVSCLPYRNEEFDAVFMFGVLHHVPDWQGALADIVRTLKKGGCLFFEEIYPSLYQNFITKHILLHPRENRFRSDDLKVGMKKANLSVRFTWEVKKIGILGIAEKTG